MKKNDYSKCPLCNEQIYMYVGNVESDNYECYKTRSDGSMGEEIEIVMGSRMDRVDYVEDETFYTCNLALAQGVEDDFETNACEKYIFKSLKELKYSIDYYSIIKRKEESNNSGLELEMEEVSISSEWVDKNIDQKLFNDEEFAKWALKIDGLLLEYFSNKIRSNMEIVTIAIENNSNASLYLGNEILNSKNNILQLLDFDKEILSKVKIDKEYLMDKKFVEECILKNGNIVLIDLFPKEYLKDKHMMSLAIVNAFDSETLIKEMPDEIKNDNNFWTNILSEYEFTSWGFIYEYLPNSIKSNSAIFNAAVENNDSVILKAPDEFKTKEIFKKIIQKSIDEGTFISVDIIKMAKEMGDSDLNKTIQLAYNNELVEE